MNTYNDYTSEPKLFYIESEQFYICFSQLKNSKSITVVNILINNVFKYQSILNNKIVSPTTPTPYIFNLSINSQYNNTKFKGLLINLSTST